MVLIPSPRLGTHWPWCFPFVSHNGLRERRFPSQAPRGAFYDLDKSPACQTSLRHHTPSIHCRKVTFGTGYSISMSAMVRHKPRKIYPSDKKDRSAFEKPSTTNTVEIESTCPICQESVGEKNLDGITESWSILPCGHQFGSHCLKKYLRIVANTRATCPVCRQLAYHGCGHPVLPALITSKPGERKRSAEANNFFDPDVLTMHCEYCRLKEAWPRSRRSALKRVAIWLIASPKRLLKRNRRSRGNGNGPVLLPWGDGDGPYIDPFPRQRDPQWERWWDRQAPNTA